MTYRNVLDAMVSFRDSHEQGIKKLGERGHQDIWLPKHGPNDWNQFDEHGKWLWIATNIVPWLFSFYVSWSESQLRCCFVHYTKHYQDEIAGMNRILRHLDWDKRPTDDQLAAVVAPRDGRFNLGKTGRGLEQIPQDVVDIVYTLASAWGPYWGPRLTKELIEEV